MPSSNKPAKPFPAARSLFDNKIEWLPLSSLRPNPRNSRTHSKAQLKLIQKSINAFGQIKPVIADDQNTILAGHGFVEAAKGLGLSTIAVLRFDHLNEAQKRAYLIADNKIAAEAGWNRELLAVELPELSELLSAEGFDISLTGFKSAEIDLLLADMSSSTPEDEGPLPKVLAAPAAMRGDIWQLGNHRLLCDDSREPDSFKRLMRRDRAAACFCDPPFNVRVSSIMGRGRHRHREFAFASGEMKQLQFRRFLASTLSNGIDVSLPGAMHFVCMDWRHIDDLIEAGRQIYEEMLNLIVWTKTNAGQGSLYRSQHELIGVFKVGGAKHRNNIELGRFGRNRSNVWHYAGANAFSADRADKLAAHPTVKPTPLVADALLDCTARGDIVLDQFCGSGTTILAAEKVGRIARCIEYEPRYVDVAIMRWQQQTKQEAVLDDDGRTFEEVRRGREAQPGDLRPPHSESAQASSARKPNQHKKSRGARGR
jgi:DNA modification methylase